MNVKGITPVLPAGSASPERGSSKYLVIFLAFSHFLRRVVATSSLMIGRIILTIEWTGRQHGTARTIVLFR